MNQVYGGARPELARHIREVIDFPRDGVSFKDLTPLFADPVGWRSVIDGLVELARPLAPEVIVGVEARGFVVAAPVAYALGLGFVPVRKPGKLPYDLVSAQYDLEYGTDSVEMHIDAVQTGQRVLVIDDVLATGGTAEATCTLVSKLGGLVVGAAFVLELEPLGGRAKLENLQIEGNAVVSSLVTYGN